MKTIRTCKELNLLIPIRGRKLYNLMQFFVIYLNKLNLLIPIRGRKLFLASNCRSKRDFFKLNLMIPIRGRKYFVKLNHLCAIDFKVKFNDLHKGTETRQNLHQIRRLCSCC